MSFRFPRSIRLTESSDYKRVFAHAERIGGHGYVLLACANGLGRARLGLAIAKRCARRAVDRSRLKRVVRESFRLNASRLPAVDIVVLCGRGAVDIPNERLRITLDKAWKALKSQPWAASRSDSSELTST